jgi:hypothetical protein
MGVIVFAGFVDARNLVSPVVDVGSIGSSR